MSPRRGRHLAHHLCPRPQTAPGAAGARRRNHQRAHRRDAAAPGPHPRGHRLRDRRGQHHHDPPLPGPQARRTSGWSPTCPPPAATCRCPPTALGLHVHPEAHVDCLPGVGAYVGGDITAGVLRSGMHEDERDHAVHRRRHQRRDGAGQLRMADQLRLLGRAGLRRRRRDLAACGPCEGAIDEVWIDPHTFEPTFSTLGEALPVGICGSGMISLLGEMMDHRGHRQERPHRR